MSDGKISIHAPLKPLNDNKKMPVVFGVNIFGIDQVFQSLDDLVDFHPSMMSKSMGCRINNYPSIGSISEYFLNTDPALLVDDNNDSIITKANFTTYWTLKIEKNSGQVTTREYAPSGANGARPTYPYTAATDVSDGWTPVYDPSKNHKWIRVRSDDEDINDDGVYDNWTIPIPIGLQYEQNDFIENRFIRQDVSLTILTTSTGLQVDKYYIVATGTLTIDGEERTQGFTFQHKAANVYVFNGATVRETLPAPSSVNEEGNPNNEPTGYSDTIPAGSEMLWIIQAQKNAYGQLKSDWIIRRINEDPNFIRYSNTATPSPETITNLNTTAASGTQGDTDLEAAGWSSAYSEQPFIATRESDNGGSAGPPFTQWRVEKIDQESGEFQEYAFKLFDFNIATGNPVLIAPVNSDPTLDGWFDVPQQETSQKRNFVTSARKFIDGTLKTPWSKPVPYSAFDAYQISVDSDNDDDFKTDKDGNVVPSQIELTSKIFKGIDKIWEDGDISFTFSWKRVYNNGAIVDDNATSDTNEDFYTLGSSGTLGTSGYIHSGQRIVVKPDGVTGKAVFRAKIVVDMPEGDDITFEKDYSLLDVSDGIDAKSLELTANGQLFFSITEDGVFQQMFPSEIVIRAYSSNLGDGDYTWEIRNENNTAWISLKSGADQTLVLSKNGENIDVESSLLDDIFENQSERKFRVTHPSDTDGDEFTIYLQTANTVGGDRYATISSTAETIPTAADQSKTVTIGTNLAYSAGQTVLIYANASNNFEGTVTSYNSSTGVLVVNSTASFNGTGTFSSWVVNLSGAAGSAGDDGAAGSDGDDSVSAVLSNESQTVTINSETGAPFSGEIGASGKALTRVQVFKGLQLLSNTQFSISRTDSSGVTSQENAVTSGLDYREVSIASLESDFVSGYVDITVTYNSETFVKRFTLSSTRDAPGAIILDVDSDKGLVFTPDDRGNKTLTASLYDTNKNPELQTSGYQYNFKIAGTFQGWTTSRTQVITRANVNAQSEVVVQVRPTSGSVIRTRTLIFSDLTDSQVIRLFTDNTNVTNADEPPATKTDDSNVTVNGVLWRSAFSTHWNTNDPIFAVDGQEDPSDITKFIWTNPYRIKGEAGDQGPSGGFFFRMYKEAGTTLPSGTATLSQMTSAGWSANLPNADNVYVTERPWIGEGVTFDGNGNPNTDPIAGTSWSDPVVFIPIAVAGDPGDDGDDGNDGWGPIYAVEEYTFNGEKAALKLIGYIGGTGTAPTANIGRYLTNTGSGYNTDIRAATNIKGPKGDAGEGGSIDQYAVNNAAIYGFDPILPAGQQVFLRSTRLTLPTTGTYLIEVTWQDSQDGSNYEVYLQKSTTITGIGSTIVSAAIGQASDTGVSTQILRVVHAPGTNRYIHAHFKLLGSATEASQVVLSAKRVN